MSTRERYPGSPPIKGIIMNNDTKNNKQDSNVSKKTTKSVFNTPKKTEGELQEEAWLKNEYYDLDIDKNKK